MSICRKPYPSDVSDEEWSLVAPYLLLQREDAGQREHDLREVFNGLRYIVKRARHGVECRRSAALGCGVSTDAALAGGGAQGLAHRRDYRQPDATFHAEHAGYDGGKRKKSSKIHRTLDTLGQLLALNVTPSSAEDRGEVERLARTVQAVTDEHVEIAWVDQGYTGERAADAAAKHGLSLEVVKLPEAKRGFVLLPRRWVIERSFAWATRFHRLVKVYERYPETLVRLHVVAFACLMMKQTAALATGS